MPRGGVALILLLLTPPSAVAATCTMSYPGGSMSYYCPDGEAASNGWSGLEIALSVLGLAASAGAAGYAYVRTRRRRRTLTDLVHAADATYAQGKQQPDLAVPKLVGLRSEVRARHQKGRIEDGQYLELDRRISSYIVRLRLLELDRRFGTLPAPFLAEVRRLVSDGAVSEAEADLVERQGATLGVDEPARSEVVSLVRVWVAEDARVASLAA